MCAAQGGAEERNKEMSQPIDRSPPPLPYISRAYETRKTDELRLIPNGSDTCERRAYIHRVVRTRARVHREQNEFQRQVDG